MRFTMAVGCCLALCGCSDGGGRQPQTVPASAELQIPQAALRVADSNTTPPLLDIRDPAILQSLENHAPQGFALGAMFERIAAFAPSVSHGLRTNAELDAENSGYHALVERLRVDLQSFDQLGVPMVQVNADAKKFPDGNVARQFDARWLTSSHGYFLLTGIVNRADRKDFSAPPNCGEVRFIYRLAYQRHLSAEKSYASRLPFFVSLVFEYPAAADCSSAARLWQPPSDPMPQTALIEWLQDGPLAARQLRFKQIELNAQVVRFPAGLMTDTGGQAIYLLRVYQVRPETPGFALVSMPLENTPDVRKFQRDPALKRELLEFVRTHLQEIDQGVFRLPDAWLATEALSYSTLGNERVANKPFDAIFATDDDWRALRAIDMTALHFLRSPHALVERLNNATCMGCHQGNSTAGFHFMGLDRPGFFGATNEIRLPTSAHYQADSLRRRAYVQQVLAGKPAPHFRPLSYAPLATWRDFAAPDYRLAGVNDACVVDASTHFTAPHVWRCGAESDCRPLVRDAALHLAIGQCVPRSQHDLISGLACRAGTIRHTATPSTSEAMPFNFFDYRDQFDSQQIYALPENKTFTQTSYNCRPADIGVPLGRTFRNCRSDERDLHAFASDAPLPREICALVGGSAFDRCAEGNFHECLAQILLRGVLDTCHQDRFCREDYMCQALPPQFTTARNVAAALEQRAVGFCTPTYFLYQMRLDGHIPPL